MRNFLNENVGIPNKFSLKFVPKGPINNIPALVQIMAWRRSGDTPLSEPIMVRLLTHICVTQPQWVNANYIFLTAYIIILTQICSWWSNYNNMSASVQATSHYLSQWWPKSLTYAAPDLKRLKLPDLYMLACITEFRCLLPILCNLKKIFCPLKLFEGHTFSHHAKSFSDLYIQNSFLSKY